MRAILTLVLLVPLFAACSGPCGSANPAQPTRIRSSWFTYDHGDFRNAPLREGAQSFNVGGERTVRVETAPDQMPPPSPAPEKPPAPAPPVAMCDESCPGGKCGVPPPPFSGLGK